MLRRPALFSCGYIIVTVPFSAVISSHTSSRRLQASSTSSSSSSPSLSSHRLAHQPQMTRRPALPRAGNLEPSKFIEPRGRKASHQHRIYSDPNFGNSDAVESFYCQLDVWRQMIMSPQTNTAAAFVLHRGVAPRWDVIIPLLETLREAGRVNSHGQVYFNKRVQKLIKETWEVILDEQGAASTMTPCTTSSAFLFK